MNELQKAVNNKITKTLAMGFSLPKTSRRWAKRYLKTQKYNHQAGEVAKNALSEPIIRHAGDTTNKKIRQAY